MILLNGTEELTLNFSTRNYMQLKKMLKSENLRRTLLTAAVNSDFEVLAQGIKQFAESGKIKDINAAYDVIDNEVDKQGFFYDFIAELGENGFFEKATPEQLRMESMQPDININEIINKVAPEAARDAMKNSMTTGANISQTSGLNVLSQV